MGAYCRRYPGIELQLESSEGFINLLELWGDMAIRIGELSDSSRQTQPPGHSRLRVWLDFLREKRQSTDLE